MDAFERSDERRDLLEFLPEDSRELLLKNLDDTARIDPAVRALLLDSLNSEEIKAICSNIAEQVRKERLAIPFTTILYEGDLQAVRMVTDMVLNGGDDGHFGIALDCGSETKKAVLIELFLLIKALRKNPAESDILAEIAKATATFMDEFTEDEIVNVSQYIADTLGELTSFISGFKPKTAPVPQPPEEPTGQIGIIG